MATQPLSHIRVPADGPLDAKIMVVGESPGKEEEEQGRPFAVREQGRMNAGSLINRYFADNLGIRRGQIYYTNLCKFRPWKNKFENCLGTKELADGLRELKADIERIKPNVIMAAGAWPMYYLTDKTGSNKAGKPTKPGSGILLWRGSVLPCTLVPGSKVVACLHPAFVLRAWDYHPIFLEDLKRVVRNSTFSDVRYPVYESFIDPPYDELKTIIAEMDSAEWIACDIETFPGRISCVGFADSEKRGLCLTYKNPYWREAAAEILSNRAKKIWQFGTYDVNFLHRFPRIEATNWAFDTYIAAASIMPEFKRGLDFLCSIYTDFPYYKPDRKEWREKDDISILWEYNIKDCIATYVIAMAQMKELKEMFDEYS